MGCEVAGWPLHFYECGGILVCDHKDVLAFVVDVLFAIALAIASGIAFRNGIGPILDRARLLFRKVRTWPNEDGSYTSRRAENESYHFIPRKV